MSSSAGCCAIAWTLPRSSSSPALSGLAAPSSPGRCGCGRGRGTVRPAPVLLRRPRGGSGALRARTPGRPPAPPALLLGWLLAGCMSCPGCVLPPTWSRVLAGCTAGLPGSTRRGPAWSRSARPGRSGTSIPGGVESLKFIRFGPLDPGLGFLSFSDLRRIVTLPLTTWALALILAVSDGARRNQTVFRPTGKHPWRMDILGSVEAPSLPGLFILPAVRDAHAAAPRGPPWGSVQVW